MAVADRLLSPQMIDPAREQSKVSEVLDFMVRDRGAESPAALMDYIGQVDAWTSKRWPKRGLLDRLWLGVHEIRRQQSAEVIRTSG